MLSSAPFLRTIVISLRVSKEPSPLVTFISFMPECDQAFRLQRRVTRTCYGFVRIF